MTETFSSGGDCPPPPAVTGSFEIDQCKICFNDFDLGRHIPKLLGCSHTFCLECLEELHSTEGRGWRIGCPVCRHRTPLREYDTRSLPDNTAVTELLPIIEHQYENSSDTLENTALSSPSAMIQDDVGCKEVYRRCAFATCLVCAIFSFLSMGVFLVMGFLLIQADGFAVLYGQFFLFGGGFCALVALIQCWLLCLLKQRSEAND